MADELIKIGAQGNKKRLRDMSDGSFAEVMASALYDSSGNAIGSDLDTIGDSISGKRGIYAMARGHRWNGAAWMRQRTWRYVASILGGATGPTVIATPTSGKKITILGWEVCITGQCTVAAANDERISLYASGANTIGLYVQSYIPSVALSTQGALFWSGLMWLQEGIQLATNATVDLVCSHTISGGDVFVSVFYDED